MHQEASWQILGVFDTTQDCGEAGALSMAGRESAARKEGRQVERIKNMIDERFRPQPYGVFSILTGYLCLPETIDRRAPKTP